ncbi:MAG: helix-turn-helix transcriptional regulator [Planctomycetota bacterium]
MLQTKGGRPEPEQKPPQKFGEANGKHDREINAYHVEMAVAFALREEDPKRWTQAAVAAELGVSREAVSKWFTNNGNGTKACKPDARVKLVPEAKAAAPYSDRSCSTWCSTSATIALNSGVSGVRSSLGTPTSFPAPRRVRFQTAENAGF